MNYRLVALKDVQDTDEFWKGTRLRLYNVGLNVKSPKDDFYEYMLSEYPGDREQMLVICVEGYKSGSILASIPTPSGASKFVVTGKTLKHYLGIEHVFLLSTQ